MKLNKQTGKFWRHGLARAASNHLIPLILLSLTLPQLLSAQTLVHRYSFVSDASDSVGGAAWNGTVEAPSASGTAATIANGLTLPGGGGPGFSGFVQLPAGILVGHTNLTVEFWATQTTVNTWAEAWSFNNGTAEYMSFIPFPANNNNDMDYAIRHNNNEYDVTSSVLFPTGTETYVAQTFNGATLVGNLFTNGTLIGTASVPDSTYNPGNFGGASGTANNYMGQDPWPDPQFQGTIYEFRIWDGVVSQRYLAASTLLGPSILVNNLVPTSAALSAGPSVIITGTEQATFTVQLPQTGSANLVATGDATNWVSSNPGVLAVNSSGLITGVGVGNATVSATVAGVKATSGTITVTGPQALLHRYSFVSDASDSVGGPAWNGTLVAATGATGTNATISEGLVLPGGGGGGFSGYLALPSGILTNTTSISVEAWATQNAANTWATIWDFGNNGNQNFQMCPFPGRNNGDSIVAFNPNANELDLDTAVSFPDAAEQYVCVTYNNFTLTGNLYTNGTLNGTLIVPNTTYCPGTYAGTGGTTNNWLGNDVYGDPQFQGTVYEFRIWNGALSPVYVAVAAAAGPTVVVTNLTPTSLAVNVTNTSMLGSQTQQATVVGTFKDASDVTVTAGATNWLSSNPNILTVNSSGLITGVSGGTANVSATVNGVSATSATITVQSTAPTVSQGPVNTIGAVNSSTTFSVLALGGGLTYQWSFDSSPITGATNNTLTLNNLSLTNAGTYSVQVLNSIGSTNLSAVLTVQQAVLVHRYSFVSDASDSVGNANGAVVAPGNASGTAVTINDGLVLPGGGGPGYSGYVTLPAGILTNTTSITVECWATQNSQNGWAELWNFGNSQSQYFGFIPNPVNNNGNMSLAVRNGTEYDAFSTDQFPNGSEQYVAATFNASTLVANLYTNGSLIASVTAPSSSYTPGTYGAGAGGTLNNVLGQDPFPDPQFQGTIYELRIWNGAVSPLYLTASTIAGPGVVITNTTIQTLTVSANTSILPGATEQATATGTLLQVSGVPVTSSVTNWTSSDTSVLTVNSAGVITAVNTGSATVSATVNGVTGTSPSITVPPSGPQITGQPSESTENLLAGASLNISITAVGTPPLVYKLYDGATLISTLTNSSNFVIPGLLVSGSGNYTVQVSNAYGSTPSSPVNITVVPPTPYQQVLLQLDAIAYWPLSESSGTTAYDMIGGVNGTYTNSFTLDVAGPTNSFFGASSSSAGFDGATAYVDIPGAAFDITNAITVVAWVQQPFTAGFDGLFGKGDPSWRMSINPSSQPGGNDGTSASADATATTAMALNAWHMVAYTYSGDPGAANNGSLYVDGALAGHNTVVTAPLGDNLDVWIAGAPDYATARLLPADVAHAAIFEKALTAAQVQGLYNGTFVAGPESLGVARSGSNLVLTWQTGVLLQAPTLNGPWTTNSAAVSPYTVPIGPGNLFFRVQESP